MNDGSAATASAQYCAAIHSIVVHWDALWWQWCMFSMWCNMVHCSSLGCSVVHWDALLSVLNMMQCCNCASLGWEIVQLLTMVKYSSKKRIFSNARWFTQIHLGENSAFCHQRNAVMQGYAFWCHRCAVVEKSSFNLKRQSQLQCNLGRVRISGCKCQWNLGPVQQCT